VDWGRDRDWARGWASEGALGNEGFACVGYTYVAAAGQRLRIDRLGTNGVIYRETEGKGRRELRELGDRGRG
jgi:hypothetical protein